VLTLVPPFGGLFVTENLEPYAFSQLGSSQNGRFQAIVEAVNWELLAAYLVQRLPIAKDEVDRAHNERVFEEMASSVVVEGVLLAIESAAIKCIEIARGSQRYSLLLNSSVWWWRGVLQSSTGNVRKTKPPPSKLGQETN